jgi:uncharacterized membrane protein SpoIIM required for sporulation
MREVVFAKKNKDKWRSYEKMLSSKTQLSSHILTEIYLDLTDDLAYANTYYPDSQLTHYLHQLAGQAHRKIYTTKKESVNSVWYFYSHSFPLFFYKYRNYLLISLAVFVLFSLIGAFSAAHEGNFVRLILGDSYVDMTLKNIANGDPMAVYKQQGQLNMFLGITINNIKVALMTFVYGLLLGLGTIYFLMKNAIMLGSFQYFFYDQGVLGESLKTIWIHGTIEIFVIIVAGAAGLVLASGILLPGTYTRKEAFIMKARDGLKIVLSTLPFFIIAGFMEGFITRHTEMPLWLSLLIILSSLGLVIYYYFILPQKIYKLQFTKNT